jgi:hypothetical protein
MWPAQAADTAHLDACTACSQWATCDTATFRATETPQSVAVVAVSVLESGC